MSFQINFEQEIPVREKTARNIKNIEHYRESTPAHEVLASTAQALGVGFGSLRNMYAPAVKGWKTAFLLVMDENARSSVPVEVAKHICDALNIPAIAVDFSAYTRESFLRELFTTDSATTENGYFCLPRYAEGKPLLTCRNLRTGKVPRKLSLKTLADFIMQELDKTLGSTPYASWNREKQEHGTIPSKPCHLTDETYKLLDDPADFVDFHTKAINTDLLKVIDFDAILYDKQTLKPLLLAEVKHLGGWWTMTKAAGEKMAIPAGLMSFEKRPLRFSVQGFDSNSQESLSQEELVAFIKERLGL